ncbi:MAG: YbaB/EbfC family nucleoid-associated protein [Chloroflexi bacterium]|nr:YbaB/EbfC family nucleoid-associated protein [Chloroflexota bacterium]
MKALQDMQRKMAKIQEELGNETVEATAGGGAVTIVISGHQKIESVKIDPEAIDPEDVSLLEDMLLTCINDAIQKSQDLAQKRMGVLTAGLKLPPGMM